MLSQPNHAPFIVTELWNEFIAAPIPADALASLTSAYLQSGTQLQPLLRGILSHPLIFDSLDEPTMIKSPVVYTVGVLRATGAPLQAVQTDALADMLQQPYHPPNVAGWPGGLAWMTTGTSIARFSLIPECQGVMAPLTDVPGETPSAGVRARVRGASARRGSRRRRRRCCSSSPRALRPRTRPSASSASTRCARSCSADQTGR